METSQVYREINASQHGKEDQNERQTCKSNPQTFGKRFSKSSHPSFPSFLGNHRPGCLINLSTILIGQVIDQVLVTGSSQVFWQIFLQMILVVIGNTLVQWANPLLYNRLIFSYTRDLREKIIQKLHRLPIALQIDKVVGKWSAVSRQISSSWQRV